MPILMEFYAKHDPSKTVAQIQELVARHMGGSKFETLYGKMKKHDEGPQAMTNKAKMERALKQNARAERSELQQTAREQERASPASAKRATC